MIEILFIFESISMVILISRYITLHSKYTDLIRDNDLLNRSNESNYKMLNFFKELNAENTELVNKYYRNRHRLERIEHLDNVYKRKKKYGKS